MGTAKGRPVIGFVFSQASRAKNRMPVKRGHLELVRPDTTGVPPEVMQYIALLEIAAPAGGVEETKNPINPRHWPTGVLVTIALAVASLFVWTWNRGGDWQDTKRDIAEIVVKQTAIELRLETFEKTYARRDLLEQQMNYMINNLNELKVKVDAMRSR